jgi:hypothetical protein
MEEMLNEIESILSVWKQRDDELHAAKYFDSEESDRNNGRVVIELDNLYESYTGKSFMM